MKIYKSFGKKPTQVTLVTLIAIFECTLVYPGFKGTLFNINNHDGNFAEKEHLKLILNEAKP